jgi:hypothetical protein
MGALDLYSTRANALTSSQLKQVEAAVAIPIASTLFREANDGEPDGIAMPAWLNQDSVEDRMNVWVAVGMSMEALHRSNTDALAMLRGYAYAHSLTLDQVATLLTNKGLQPDELLA